MIKPQINPFQKYPILPTTIPNNIHIINSVPANLYFSNIGRYTETGLQGSFLLNHNSISYGKYFSKQNFTGFFKIKYL